MKFAEEWLKGVDPIAAIIEMMIEDVDLNTGVRYDIDYYKVNEVIDYFNNESEKHFYVPPKNI